MPTNLLAMPLIAINVETSNNEDWIDTILYMIDPGDESPPTEQLDLRGIDFLMEIRRQADSHEVILSASTDDGTLAVGTSPDYGYFMIHVPLETMRHKFAGDYVGDVVGMADENTRVVIRLNLTILEGVSK